MQSELVRPMTKLPAAFLGYPFDLKWIRESVERAAQGVVKIVVASDVVRGKPLLIKIKDMMEESDLCLFDLTSHNPNVAVELGVAQGLGLEYLVSYCTDPIHNPRPDRASPIFADMEGWDAIRYSDAAGLERELRARLPEIAAHAANAKLIRLSANASLPRPSVHARARIMGPDEYRSLGFKPSTAQHLIVEVKNSGPGVVRDVRVRALDGGMMWMNESIGPIGERDDALGDFRVETNTQGTVIGAPNRILIEYDADGWQNGRLILASGVDPYSWKVVESQPPTATT
jgi:hypothetical protein